MRDYTIQAISEKVKNWSNAYGDFSTYTVKFSDSDDAVEINKKSDSPAPKSGDVVYGEITSTEFGYKFKSAKRPPGETASSSTPQESDERQDPIYRSVALNNASVVSAAVITAGGVPKDSEKMIADLADGMLKWLKNEPIEQPAITKEKVDEVFNTDEMPEDFGV